MTSILNDIAAAMPHDPDCPGDTGKCTCGIVGKRNVLYYRVQAHVAKLTKGRIYLDA